MFSPDLLLICGTAFIAVFIMLAFLAIIMRLIIFFFPQKEEGTDTAMIAAVTTTYNLLFPNSTIKNIEEKK